MRDVTALRYEGTGKLRIITFAPRVPAPDAVLWRFMGVMKFMSVLSTNCLYFPHVDNLPDSWGGSFPNKPSNVGKRIRK